MTFPLVISAIALLKLQIVADAMFQPQLVSAIEHIATVELWVASAVVAYVGWQYLKHIGHGLLWRELRVLHG